jgi:hypothetical protein
MSDGHYSIIRDLGPVKGGKGLKHHEVVVDFTVRALIKFLSLRRRRNMLQTHHSERRPADIHDWLCAVREFVFIVRSGCTGRFART